MLYPSLLQLPIWSPIFPPPHTPCASTSTLVQWSLPLILPSIFSQFCTSFIYYFRLALIKNSIFGAGCFCKQWDSVRGFRFNITRLGQTLLLNNKLYKNMIIYLIVLVSLLHDTLAQTLQHTQNHQVGKDQLELGKKTHNIYFTEPLHESGSSHPSKKVGLLNHSLVEGILAYSGKFRKLNFNLEDQELVQLGFDTLDLYAKDKIALFFISAYFLRACQILEFKKIPVPEIASLIKKKVRLMMNITSIETYRKRKYGIQGPNDFNSLNWQALEKEISSMTPKTFKLLPSRKDEQIEDIIIEMAKNAQHKFALFNFITQIVCESSNCKSHRINLKIEGKHQRSQMKRIKEKLLRDYFKKFGNRCLNTFLNIAWKRKIEEVGFQNLLAKVYEGLNQIDFIVKDMLRAKCMFASITQIYSAAISLLGMVKNLSKLGHSIKLVQFQNRLNKITCDVMLIIQIDDLACQVQLSLDYDENLFQISHKMYQISRSKVFSPIVLLFDWFQQIAPEFLYKIGQFLKGKVSDHTELSMKRPQSLIQEYQLLNQFFHLTSYHDLGYISDQEFSKEVSEEISSLKDEIVKPFAEIDGEL